MPSKAAPRVLYAARPSHFGLPATAVTVGVAGGRVCFFGWGGRVLSFYFGRQINLSPPHYTTPLARTADALRWVGLLRLQSARAMDGLGLDDIRIKRVVVVDSISHFAHAHTFDFFFFFLPSKRLCDSYLSHSLSLPPSSLVRHG